MRVLLVSLNAKYIHTNLAIRYLREEIREEFPNTLLREFTINQSVAQIAAEIFEAKADVIGFSCYIWNLARTLAVIRWLHPVCSGKKFVLGGPEVSYETEKLLEDHPEIDAVVRGEGERAFPELLRAWERENSLGTVAGIAFRESGGIFVTGDREETINLAQLPEPYGREDALEGRLVYLETTRGCPFACQYCLSSVTRGVRFLPPERFRMSFRRLLTLGARTIKFVDRTFNANKNHAFQILEIIKEETAKAEMPRAIRVHCEMAGELLDGEWLAYLKDYPEGLLQLEIGVQSTHQPTLEIIKRSQNFSRWRGYIRELRQKTVIPIHLDLIAGLPEEDWGSFRRSFNEVYAVEPDMLQLGFLKLLKGSGLRQHSLEYGLIYAPDPPYTILQTGSLSHEELLGLERLEELLNQYYNSGKFTYTLRYLLTGGAFTSPFDFYHEFAQYWQERSWFGTPVQGKALLQRLWGFCEEIFSARGGFNLDLLRESLRFDLYLWERPGAIPEFLQAKKGTGRISSEEPDSGLGGAPRSKLRGQTASRKPAPGDGGISPLNKRSDLEKGQELRAAIYEDPAWLERIPEIGAMDRRQWARACALDAFSFDILKELPLLQAGKGNPRKLERVWYLFFYQGETKAYRVP